MSEFRITALSALVLFFALLSSPCDAQSPELERQREQFVQRQNHLKLSNWDSIIFICSKGEPALSESDRICSAALAEARLIAAQSGIRLQYFEREGQGYFEAARIGALQLELKIAQSRPGTSPSAIAINVVAWALPSVAETWRFDPQEPLKVLEKTQRAGDLVLFESPTSIGASTDGPETLVSEMIPVAEDQVKSFFATYIEAQTYSRRGSFD
ncbi:MAG: hypothetical protein O9256_00555 [Rhizobiaceae bacterium]|nr:hypothetical protein [Rhizobiaceae bacterium]